MLRKIFLVFLLMLAMGCAGAGTTAANGGAPRMSKDDLKARLGSPDLVILDVRSGPDWKAGDGKISGAIREEPREFERWATKYPKEKTIVLYCA